MTIRRIGTFGGTNQGFGRVGKMLGDIGREGFIFLYPYDFTNFLYKKGVY